MFRATVLALACVVVVASAELTILGWFKTDNCQLGTLCAAFVVPSDTCYGGFASSLAAPIGSVKANGSTFSVFQSSAVCGGAGPSVVYTTACTRGSVGSYCVLGTAPSVDKMPPKFLSGDTFNANVSVTCTFSADSNCPASALSGAIMVTTEETPCVPLPTEPGRFMTSNCAGAADGAASTNKYYNDSACGAAAQQSTRIYSGACETNILGQCMPFAKFVPAPMSSAASGLGSSASAVVLALVAAVALAAGL
eukprot:Amastigsp_a175253_354.p1 type:complete len:252 gc:universal Amastigsp_a175253_354:39-794(+)